MKRLMLLSIVAVVGILTVACDNSNKPDPAINVPRPAGAERPAAPGVGGGGGAAAPGSTTEAQKVD